MYKGVGEVSIYIAPDAKRKGIGDLLLNHMIVASEKEGFWTLESKIFKENVASLKLHKKMALELWRFEKRLLN